MYKDVAIINAASFIKYLRHILIQYLTHDDIPN